jgi:uracil-DNA glycosylase
MFAWFAEHLGVDQSTFRERVHIGAVIRCFPGRDEKAGGDRVPDAEEIARCGAHLDREIALLQPALVIAVGTLASQQLVGIAQLKAAVGVQHRVTRAGHAFDVAVLPHPSGRSTWLNKPEHMALLLRAMKLIREHPAWRSVARAASQAE